ncbi:Muscle calcium channel subunit alpha-1 [Folsomia candida]|uniref:Muscle calcium channel subunit alpha-1 n=1 Tax=Folsomia candida TaxID=158441 RepID=A0A226EDF4_FOLCA|nr:Muscle calcium channel subunit alpha-1 [Folsomia candida]
MIFALLGMQIMGGKFNYDKFNNKPRNNFDSFSQSLLTVFQILTGEDWNVVMYQGIEAHGGVASLGIVASLYFIVLFIFGNYILLNVFLAIAVDNLGDAEDVDKDEADAGAAEEAVAEEGVEEEDEDAELHEEQMSQNSGEEEEQSIRESEGVEEEEEAPVSESDADATAGSFDNDQSTEPGIKKEPQPKKPPPPPDLLDDSNKTEPIPEASSFFIFSHDNSIRVFFHKIISNSIFGNIILVCILISSSLLGAEDPLYEDSPRNQLLNKFDYFFTSVFTIELTLKLTVYGFVFHEGAFCRSAANLLDLLVVCVSLITFFSASSAVSTIKILRVFRVLRPLRAINRAKGLKRVIQCMIVAIKTIGNIVIVINLLQFMYAVIGVQLFKGGLFKCTDASRDREETCRMLYSSIDSSVEDRGPIHDNKKIVAAYYISYLIVISFFMINIFVGFVILTFQNEGEQEYRHCELEKNQRNCLEFALKAKPMPKYIPQNRFQYRFWSVVTSQTFEYLNFSLIMLNTISLAMKFYNQPDWYTDILAKGNIFFTAVFTIEFMLKLAAFGVKVYFADAWNVFDFLIVVGSFVDIIFEDLNVSFLKLFRIFGKIALNQDTDIHRNNNFQNFGNAVMLLFRCATGEAWQDIMMACVNNPEVECFHKPVETQNLTASAYVDTDGIEGMDLSSLEMPTVTPEPSCGSDFAYPYFISFFVLCSFLILNLFVAVIMDNFDYLTRDWSILGAHHLGEFIHLWSEYDPDARGCIKHVDVLNLLRRINPPLGFGKLCPRRMACKRLVAMNMPMNSDGTVQFNATIFALVRTGLQIKTEGNIMEADEQLRRVIRAIWKDTDPLLLDQVVPPPDVFDEVTVGKFYASELIQEQYRKYHRRKKKHMEQTLSDLEAENAFKLTAGLRELQTLGPTLKRTISGDLEQAAEGNDITPLHRRNHMLFGTNKKKPLAFSKANHHSPHSHAHHIHSNHAAQTALHSLYDTLSTSQFNSMFGGGTIQRIPDSERLQAPPIPERSQFKGSAQCLVGLTLNSSAALRRYSRDPTFVESASEELRQALGMSPSEMERAAYRVLNEKYPVHFEAIFT